MIEDQLILLHPFVVHVSIVSILFSFVTSLTASILWAIDDQDLRLREIRLKLFFTSYLLLVIGEITLPISILTGFIDAGSLTTAANQPLLAFKITISVLLFFVLMIPLLINIYTKKLLRSSLFDDDKLFTFLYVFFLFIGSLMILVVGAAGGYYVYSHSFFDTIGLGAYFPDLIPENLRQNAFNSYLPSIIGLILYFALALFPLKFAKEV